MRGTTQVYHKLSRKKSERGYQNATKFVRIGAVLSGNSRF
jgi:hypothetical protein